MPPFPKTPGKYFGTEINEKWWKRYRQQKMLARGSGTFWSDDQAILFHRKLTREPITIPFRNIIGFKVGKWHAGQWGGGAEVLKVLWRKESQKLSSGFVVSGFEKSADELIGELEALIPSGKLLRN
jgi:hypothetical protein